MKDNHFVIKIADLLKEGGRSDTISFRNKPLNDLPDLSPEWVSWTLTLRSLNNEAIYADLEHVNCQLNEFCDTCEAPYTREVYNDHYTARFVLGEENRALEQEHTDEEIFLIDEKNENIDIHDMLLQSILLEQPVVKHCSNCAKKLASLPDDEDEAAYLEGTGNVVFH